MIKRLFVPTDGSDAAMVGVQYAVALARRWEAAIHGLFVVDVKLLEGPFLRDLSASLGTAPYVNYQGNIAMILEERGKMALAEVEKLCAEAGVSCQTQVVTGIVSRSIIEYAELSDLIVMGRSGEHHEWLEGFVGATTEAVIRRAQQPVLITNREAPGNGGFLVAYDGTQHAREALRTAANVVGVWQAPLHLLVVGEAEDDALLEEARQYLQAHEIPAQFDRREGDAGEVIVAYAKEQGLDLIIMGAYGHSKVREWVVGSTCNYVINHSHCPILLNQ